MLTQIIANVLYALIATGMLVQLVTLGRYAVRIARKRRAVRARVRTDVRPEAPPKPVRLKTQRRRDYRVALRAARLSVSA